MGVRAGAGFTPTDPQHFATKGYVDGKSSSGGQQVYVQQANPGMASPGLWWQTDAQGNLLTLWVENGVAASTATPTLTRQNTASPPISSTPTVTLPAVVAGHGLVLTLADWGPNPKAVTSVTDTANGSWTRVAYQADANFGQQEIWVCTSHPGSASTLTVTLNLVASASTAINITEWSTGLTVDQTNTVDTSGTNPTVTVGSKSNDLVVSTFSSANNSLPAAQSPAASLTAVTGASSYCANASAYLVASTTTATVSYAPVTSTNYGVVAASFTPA